MGMRFIGNWGSREGLGGGLPFLEGGEGGWLVKGLDSGRKSMYE